MGYKNNFLMKLLPVLIVAKLFTSILTYHITVPDIFGDSLQKCYWQDFKLVVLSIVWKETHAYSLNGVATFNLAIIICDSPNCQVLNDCMPNVPIILHAFRYIWILIIQRDKLF